MPTGLGIDMGTDIDTVECIPMSITLSFVEDVGEATIAPPTFEDEDDAGGGGDDGVAVSDPTFTIVAVVEPTDTWWWWWWSWENGVPTPWWCAPTSCGVPKSRSQKSMSPTSAVAWMCAWCGGPLPPPPCTWWNPFSTLTGMSVTDTGDELVTSLVCGLISPGWSVSVISLLRHSLILRRLSTTTRNFFHFSTLGKLRGSFFLHRRGSASSFSSTHPSHFKIQKKSII